MDHEVTKLADFATSQPQACYAAFTFGLRHRWTYFLRTLPDIAELLAPLTIQSLKQSATSLVSLCAWEALDLQIL